MSGLARVLLAEGDRDGAARLTRDAWRSDELSERLETDVLETFRDPNRGFDAVVIGEPQRAFYGNQFGLTFPVFVHYGIGLWVPEVGGAVDPGSEAHDLVMSLYGGMSKGERTRKLCERSGAAAGRFSPRACKSRLSTRQQRRTP